MKSMLFSFFLLLGLLFISTPAMAHGGAGIAQDECVSTISNYRLHFSAYQPQALGGKELCWDIPSAGNTIIVFDMVEEALRHRPAEVRIVKHLKKGEGPVRYKTVAEMPLQEYPSGTIELEANFPEPGRYTGVVAVAGDRPLIFKAPIRVAISNAWQWIIVGGVVIVVVAAVLGYEWWRRKGKGTKQEAAA